MTYDPTDPNRITFGITGSLKPVNAGALGPDASAQLVPHLPEAGDVPTDEAIALFKQHGADPRYAALFGALMPAIIDREAARFHRVPQPPAPPPAQPWEDPDLVAHRANLEAAARIAVEHHNRQLRQQGAHVAQGLRVGPSTLSPEERLRLLGATATGRAILADEDRAAREAGDVPPGPLDRQQLDALLSSYPAGNALVQARKREEARRAQAKEQR